MAFIVQDEGGRMRCEQCPQMARFHRFNFDNKTEEFICPNGHITATPEVTEPKKKQI